MCVCTRTPRSLLHRTEAASELDAREWWSSERPADGLAVIDAALPVEFAPAVAGAVIAEIVKAPTPFTMFVEPPSKPAVPVPESGPNDLSM